MHVRRHECDLSTLDQEHSTIGVSIGHSNHVSWSVFHLHARLHLSCVGVCVCECISIYIRVLLIHVHVLGRLKTNKDTGCTHTQADSAKDKCKSTSSLTDSNVFVCASDRFAKCLLFFSAATTCTAYNIHVQER